MDPNRTRKGPVTLIGLKKKTLLATDPKKQFNYLYYKPFNRKLHNFYIRAINEPLLFPGDVS